LRVEKIDDHTCELTDTVISSLTPEQKESLAREGIPIELVRATKGPAIEAHNRQETPLFALSIERHALKRRELATA
jgi:hypothetical protein